MGGLLVLFLLGLYVWGAYKVVRRVRSVWGKVLLVLVLILIPTADAVYGRYELKQMCAKDGGVKINRVVSNVDGFMDTTASRITATSTETEWLTKYGFEFIESKAEGGLVDRVTRQPDGKLIEEKEVQPRSRFIFDAPYGEIKRGFGYNEYRVIDSANKEILALSRNITYRGGWVESLLAIISDAGRGSGYAGACLEGRDQIVVTQFITDVLNPVHKK